MPQNTRVFQVAKLLKIDSGEILDALSDMGRPVSSDLAPLDPETVEELKSLFKPKPKSARAKIEAAKKQAAAKAKPKKKPAGPAEAPAAAAAAAHSPASATPTAHPAGPVHAPHALPGQQGAPPALPHAASAPGGAAAPAVSPQPAFQPNQLHAPALVAPPPAAAPGRAEPVPFSQPAPGPPWGPPRPGYPGLPSRLRRGPRRRGAQQPQPLARKPAKPEPPLPAEVTLTEGVTVKELSDKLGRKSKDIIKKLLDRGSFVTINQPLDPETAVEICKEYGVEAKVISFEEEHEELGEPLEAGHDPRPPVVTIMGHVDHGKTSLLDAIRSTNVVETEHGGITQHIGAYSVEVNGRGIVFLDTPGHEAFTMMRARGAQATDIVVLVVAADDGVKPQTIEAIDHAKAAAVPIVVAINKIDKPATQPERVKQQLSEHGLLAEDWGGDVVMVPVSAKQKTGLDHLLEMILLVADMRELKASPERRATGTVLEAKLDRTRGPVATVLVQNGTLKVGDPFIAGAVSGKVRAMFDDLGRPVRVAQPSTPVQVLGLQDVPRAGDRFQAMADELKVRQIGTFRQEKLRQESLLRTSRLTLDHLHQQIASGSVKELPMILKADVQGSVEVLSKTLGDLPTDRVKLRIIHSATGAITPTDVLLASASNAIIIGFNVRPERSAAELADKEQVDIRLHTVIYNVTNEIKNAMAGLLEPTFKETYLGRAEVRDTFRIPRIGEIAGCFVSDGRIVRNAEVRLLRDNVVIYEGKIASLKRFKDDASEVKQSFECGIGLDRFNDIKVGDVIEAFMMERVAPRLMEEASARTAPSPSTRS